MTVLERDSHCKGHQEIQSRRNHHSNQNMAWGTELWDQFDNIALHTQKGLDFLDKYGRLIRDRSDVENRYAADLRSLVKKYQLKKKDDDMQFTSHSAYRAMLAEVGDLAGQHEVVAEQLAASVVSDVTATARTLKDERKRLLHEATRLQNQLNNQRQQLEKAKKNYEKSAREAEKALENYHKADADLNLSRAEVEKQKMNSSLRDQQCEDNKNEYANQLQKTNDLQHEHYARLLPAIYDELQALDERRARCQQDHLRRAVDIERHVFPIIHTCLDGMVRAADTIDAEKDSQLVIERYKSGFEPPDSIPFEDLSSARNGEAPPAGSATMVHSSPAIADSPRGLTIKGTLSAAKFKKRGGIFGIFSGSKNSSPNASFESFMKEDLDSLPPNQRRKRIRQKLDDLTSKINQETATRDGLMKMKGVYESNPALGDPMTIESQLRENTQRLEKLRLELHKYQRLQDTNGQRCSLSEPEGNLSRSTSDSSVNQLGGAPAPAAPAAAAAAAGAGHSATLPSHISSNSPESGLGSTSHASLPGSDSDVDDSRAANGAPPVTDGGDDSELAFVDDPLPVIASASALYPFDASSEGSIPMQEGERLLVIELDQGDGWTRVRRHDSLEEGFVPTAYLQVHSER
ncbi:formin-binding protein 1-like isoform X2 [Amphibalanus amphitrite]|uniref:formin-binding protein 1-like isoform X1 n=1 Tax=Amphibalanus amphitrite TaxID=1232801 RepID=UPI001C8FCD72|nr:formin-binding protein 1-like isoform X1 [Amphibalanus amphitrite]XP_043201079.1 formin-binding protein 1-like isoform X2 [Amphibalanus amphitrite]